WQGDHCARRARGLFGLAQSALARWSQLGFRRHRSAVMALASFWAPLGLAVLGCVAAFALLGAAAVVIGGRRVVARSAEYRRVTRLLEASARTARLRTLDDALVTAAEEVRAMTKANSAMCCSLNARGQGVG